MMNGIKYRVVELSQLDVKSPSKNIMKNYRVF